MPRKTTRKDYPPDWRPRLSCDIKPEHHFWLQDLPYGSRGGIIQCLLDDLIEACERVENPQLLIGGIIARKIRLWDLSKMEGMNKNETGR